MRHMKQGREQETGETNRTIKKGMEADKDRMKQAK